MLHGAGALDTFSQQYCFSEKLLSLILFLDKII